MCRAARLFSLAVLAFFVIGSCSRAKVVTAPKPLDTSAGLGATAPACGSSTVLSLRCAAFPITDAVKQPDWDYFAWNSFIAANWPAIDPASNNEQRGFPDLTKSFASATSTDLLAWETYKEKREVFFYPPGTTTNPGPWNQAPNYGPVGGVPMCSDSVGKSPNPRRFFGQGQKLTFDSLDETVEVASEALETQAQLCSGVPNPMCGTSQQNDCCLVHGLPVGPRVWKGSPVKANPQPVLYEVKVNYDFYKYIVDNQHQYYIDANADAAATTGSITLPYRTSAAAGPGSNNAARVLGYNPTKCIITDSTVTPTSNVTPCFTGAIHLKAAWMLLQNENPSQYHTAEAAYFKSENGKKCMAYGTFGLIGLHIIQRIHQGTGSGQGNPQGGTFIFATWEHVNNDSAGFTYSNFFPGQPLVGPPKRGFYPYPAYALPVKRQFPILPGTVNVNNAVHAALPASSVWQNYELIGVQFQPINVPSAIPIGANPNDPTGIGQPLFLANSVIETNQGLQNFQGLPPFAAPIANFQKNGIMKNGVYAFNRNTPNVSFNGSAINMGGCMGCHGVAQVKGFSFSFVLLGGQQGADVDTEDSFTVPPPPSQ